ncbi:MAG: hypothetical protein J6K99_07130 [Peptococcaceae bacterium]|nr:hypothetical protein [Peptococcaceae bacterium]
MQQNRNCLICGKELTHSADCPKMGGLVCQKCHVSCEHLEKSFSLWHCMYLQKDGVVNG